MADGRPPETSLRRRWTAMSSRRIPRASPTGSTDTALELPDSRDRGGRITGLVQAVGEPVERLVFRLLFRIGDCARSSVTARVHCSSAMSSFARPHPAESGAAHAVPMANSVASTAAPAVLHILDTISQSLNPECIRACDAHQKRVILHPRHQIPLLDEPLQPIQRRQIGRLPRERRLEEHELQVGHHPGQQSKPALLGRLLVEPRVVEQQSRS